MPHMKTARREMDKCLKQNLKKYYFSIAIFTTEATIIFNLKTKHY